MATPLRRATLPGLHTQQAQQRTMVLRQSLPASSAAQHSLLHHPRRSLALGCRGRHHHARIICQAASPSPSTSTSGKGGNNSSSRSSERVSLSLPSTTGTSATAAPTQAQPAAPPLTASSRSSTSGPVPGASSGRSDADPRAIPDGDGPWGRVSVPPPLTAGRPLWRLPSGPNDSAAYRPLPGYSGGASAHYDFALMNMINPCRARPSHA